MAIVRNRSTRTLVLLACASPLLLGGCFAFATREDADKLQRQVDELQKKVATQEAQAVDLRNATKEADVQIQKMKDLVQQATDVVTRNSANLGQDVDKLKEELAHLQGRVDVAESSLNGVTTSFNDFRAATDPKLEQLQNLINASKTPPIPETADGVFAEGQRRFEAKEWNDARRLYTAFIDRYPRDARAPAAQFYIGESYFSEQKYPNAIGAFTKVVDNYPKAKEVQDAMFRNGQAFKALRYCGDARIYFQELLRRYPHTTWKKQTNDELNKLKADLKNKDLCKE